jgi:hypothetical protein
MINLQGEGQCGLRWPAVACGGLEGGATGWRAKRIKKVANGEDNPPRADSTDNLGEGRQAEQEECMQQSAEGA